MKRIEQTITTLKGFLEERVNTTEDSPFIEIKPAELESIITDLENYIMSTIVIKNSKFDYYRFIEYDKARNFSRGVFHFDGFKYATDAHNIIKVREEYPQEWERCLVGKDATIYVRLAETANRYGGVPCGEGVPPMGSILETHVTNADRSALNYVQFRPEVIQEVAKKIKLAQKTKQNDMFLFKTDDLDTGETIHFNAPLFLRFYEGCKHIGADGFYWSKRDKPFFAEVGENVCVGLPFVKGDSEGYTVIDL